MRKSPQYWSLSIVRELSSPCRGHIPIIGRCPRSSIYFAKNISPTQVEGRDILRGINNFLGEVHFTVSPESTAQLGAEVGKVVSVGMVLALVGELGAGKTVFVKGLAKGLSVQQEITSPSFQLARFYEGRLPLCHLDFYRLHKGDEYVFGLEEYLLEEGVTVIEWADRIAGIIPLHALAVRFAIQGENERRIDFLTWKEMLNLLAENDRED